MPEMTAVQPVSAAQVSTPQGELPSGLSQFSSLMNQELNNNTTNNAVQVTPDAITLPVQPAGEPETTGDILLSMVNEAVALNMNGELFAPVSENENSEGAEGSLSGSGDLLKVDSSGQIALAKFIAPEELTKMGKNLFAESSGSGQPIICAPGTSGTGQVLSSTLEMSNVDLAEEFVKMIISQRGYQANSRIVSTSDELMAELVNLTR